MGDLKEVSERVVHLLINEGISIAAAESVTGGMFAECFTSVPGASKVFDMSFVSYSNKAKIEELNVPLEKINVYGAVSKPVAALMASGLSKRCGAKISISVTGVAGPGPDERGVPEGTFFVGLHVDNHSKVRQFELGALGRQTIRKIACIEMFKFIEEIVVRELQKKAQC
jgi:nicotinamide-nucleotide amidase